MFKFNLPIKLVISTGSLSLLLFASLLLISSSVHTSDIQVDNIDHQNHQQHDSSSVPTTSAITRESASSTVLQPEADVESQPAAKSINNQDNRKRNGRLYGSSSNNHQSTLDSYAAAYAAANSPGSSADQQSTVQVANDNAYSSFGEPAPGPVSAGSVSSSPAGSPVVSSPQHSASYYASFMSPSTNEASYSGGGVSSPLGHHHYYQPPSYYKSPISSSSLAGAGYPSFERHSSPPGYFDRAFVGSMSPSQHWAAASSMPSSGLMSSASTALSHWTGGFTIGEIICTVVAIAIGAIILGAPFFLIYLALMGNFSGSGTLSLTNPAQGSTAAGGATTTVNGRRKRLAIFEQMNSKDDQKHASEFVALADSIMSQLSPFVDIQQVAGTFKRLVSSIEKYGKSNNNDIEDQKNNRRSM